MSNTTDLNDPDEIRARLLSGYGSVPPLHPPRDWSEITRDVWEEVGLRGALSGLPRDSPEFTLYSERLAEFLGVSVDELELTNE